jgi:hypothetical protein
MNEDECSCTPLPFPEGPFAGCDVHGRPSVAYRHGLAEGRRQERELVQLELRELEQLRTAARDVTAAWLGDTVYAIETKDRTFLDALDRLHDVAREA